jgi:Secretion system C-terminal sorting domain
MPFIVKTAYLPKFNCMKPLFAFCLLTLLFTACEKTPDVISSGPVDVYPNPFYNRFDVYVFEGNDVDIRVLDGSKKAIFEVENIAATQNLAINMMEQEEGVYFLEANIDGQLYTQQILKIEP